MDFENIARRCLDAPYRCQQKWTELQLLLEYLHPLKPSRVLEIGVFQGGTVMAWTHISSDDAIIVGVDLPEGEFGGGFTDEVAGRIVDLAQEDQSIFLFPADSHDKKTVEKVKGFGEFDFIFIDGDHTYEGAKKDFENYFPLLKKGGILALHDIVVHTRRPEVGVWKLWKELKKKYDIIEYVDEDYPSDWNPWGGIGVIKK
jgi:predicted O-methyltransferase YrrM